jgi:DNA-binding CsgD family transcriptional regulator
MAGNRSGIPSHKLKPKHLTPAQQRAYDMIKACNGNQSEAARRLGLSQGAIRSHVESIRNKLGEDAI